MDFRLCYAASWVEPAVGSVGHSYDSALAETINGLYKAEVIHRRGRGAASRRPNLPPSQARLEVGQLAFEFSGDALRCDGALAGSIGRDADTRVRLECELEEANRQVSSRLRAKAKGVSHALVA